MQIVERGSGRPLVLIPGLQGRWEYVRPAVHALSKWFHVVTFSLSDEPTGGQTFEPARGFDSHVEQVITALDRTRVDRAIICGISFGGLIALRFAADHPERTTALVLASTPGPSWHPRKRHELYARLPWLAGPLFLAEAPWRLRAELSAALGDARWPFVRSQLVLLVEAPLSLKRMAARALLIPTADAAARATRITSPTLVVTGEPHLDHVVPAGGSTEYVDLIPGARPLLLERTGHLGSITRADAFAAAVRDVVSGHHHAAA